MSGVVEMDIDASKTARKIKIRKSESSNHKIVFLHKINWRINILCIMGAVMAVYAATLFWLRDSMILSVGREPFDLAFNSGYAYPYMGGIILASIIFIVGALMTFITPLGGVVQLVGILWFMTAILIIDYPFHRFSLIEGNIAFGVISASISIFSMIRPFGKNYKGHSSDIIGRLLTISWSEQQEGSSMEKLTKIQIIGGIVFIIGIISLLGGIILIEASVSSFEVNFAASFLILGAILLIIGSMVFSVVKKEKTLKGV
jgi:hypothetical protein